MEFQEQKESPGYGVPGAEEVSPYTCRRPGSPCLLLLPLKTDSLSIDTLQQRTEKCVALSDSVQDRAKLDIRGHSPKSLPATALYPFNLWTRRGDVTTSLSHQLRLVEGTHGRPEPRIFTAPASVIHVLSAPRFCPPPSV
ncbi:hypothetical protein AAFF_G00300840 [Aldrovandia affinis]|uniref:Uncharacterized protein n=1 Tax=Aldrovandia affinis TaxID=143900 RepID=A0AAD7SQ05_9TELE|nr:hypothetical protein AAFF_G00300840 [Aldrovandia affinis]